MVDEILDLSAIVTGKLKIEFQKVDLAAVIRSAVDSIRPGAEEKKLTIETELDPGVVVAGSTQRLEQIFSNLLCNAVKFTAPGGRIWVKINRQHAFAEAAVKDTGMGIPPEFLPHIFDRFWQADSSTTRTYGGLGLGLAIVRELVEAHGGGIDAESAGTGKGATFRVRLPLAKKRRLKRSIGPVPERKKDMLEGVSALVVEDDKDARELITVTLEGYGARVRSADGYNAALDALQHECPDILLIDIGMPDYNGYALLAKIRGIDEKFARIPAIAVTAYASDMDRDTVLMAGFQSHVSKPFKPDELVRLVASLALHPKSGAA